MVTGLTLYPNNQKGPAPLISKKIKNRHMHTYTVTIIKNIKKKNTNKTS